MKQTITLLAFLTALLLLVSGIAMVQNAEANRLLDASESALTQTRAKLKEITEQLENSTKENSAAAEKLQQAEQERGELITQLNDALLTAQEADDSAQAQTVQNQQLIRSQQALEEENLRLTSECESLRAQLAAITAEINTHKQQIRTDEQYIAQLESQLAAEAAATGAAAMPENAFQSAAPTLTPPPLF